MPLSHLAESQPIGRYNFLGIEAMLERLAQLLASRRTTTLALTMAMAIALLAPLGPLASNRFHRDEAIYSSWGLDVARGRDILISGSPVDKPPLFLYTQALSFLLFGPTEVTARLPSLIASVVGVGLMYGLGRYLYGRGVGVLAAFLLAASPFTILFASTAFTDSMMVTWVLAGCLAATRGRWGWAGISLGLATITKQQGAFFVPLTLGVGQLSNLKSADRQSPNAKSRIVSFVVAFLVMFCLALGWDIARARQPGFLVQSLVSYGGLQLSLAAAGKHLLGFGDLLRYSTGSPVLNGVLLIGLPLLLILDILHILGRPITFLGNWYRPGPPSRAKADLILFIFIVCFLVGHSLMAFAVWDRYLLGLIPLIVLLLARVLTLPQRLIRFSSIASFVCLLFVLCMLSFTFRPIRDAVASRFPIGGDHGAYQGIQQVVGYFQMVPANTTLYHRWLGWHWRFYMWDFPYDSRAWTSPTDLAAQAAARPQARRYIVFPSWRSSTEARLALADAGLVMREVQRAFREDGSVSFVVYRIEETP
jgi:4-amino-4-deoxy-L-arabinose transferase-like glycosyltransferase